MTNDYEFNIGDVVVTTEGETGKIVDICKCDKCRKRGWYEPVWRDDDTGEDDYITDYQYESGFVGFYRIGKYRFGKFEKQLVGEKILRLKDEIEDLKKHLKTIETLEAADRETMNNEHGEFEKVVHAYWKPLKVYPDEFVCSNCGELWNNIRTPYCHECGAKMDADPGDQKQA